jgi:hypothetical protein
VLAGFLVFSIPEGIVGALFWDVGRCARRSALLLRFIVAGKCNLYVEREVFSFRVGSDATHEGWELLP